MNSRIVRLLTAALAVAACTVGPAAHANGDPVTYSNPNVEGSLLDYTNMQRAAMSDSAAVSVGVNQNGCVAVAERPQLQASPGSPTGMLVKSQVALTCQGLAAGSNTYRIERIRWDENQSLASVALSAPPAGGTATQSLTTPCRAGTWYYRVRVSGTHNFHTTSARFTCASTTSLFAIDPS